MKTILFAIALTVGISFSGDLFAQPGPGSCYAGCKTNFNGLDLCIKVQVTEYCKNILVGCKSSCVGMLEMTRCDDQCANAHATCITNQTNYCHNGYETCLFFCN